MPNKQLIESYLCKLCHSGLSGILLEQPPAPLLLRGNQKDSRRVPHTEGGLAGITSWYPNHGFLNNNNKGLTLVEVMIALSVFLLVFMGLFQTALLSVDHNVKNMLRDEAISIAAMRMEEERNRTFDNLQSYIIAIPSNADCPVFMTTGDRIQKNFRNMTKDFCINLECLEIGGDNDCTTADSVNKQLNLQVGWTWKGEEYTHDITTLVRNE